LTGTARTTEPLKTAHSATLVALLCLLCACASEEGVPAGGTSTGGTSTGGTSTGGTSTGGTSTGGTSTGGTSTGGTSTGGTSTGGTSTGGTSTGGTSTGGGTAGSAQGGGTFTLESPAFRNVAGCSLETPDPCEVFPDENVSYMDRPNISPELRWAGVPAGTQSFALVLFDVTYGQTHWALWNIPANVTVLAANVAKDTAMPATPAGARQSNANFAPGGDGYFGPHLPCNVFQFVLYALSTSTFSPMDPESAVLVGIELQELGDPVLGKATLTGRASDYMMTCE
jgi:Raf kinase inhibitor-like YbhB/YbcL family protein